MLSSCTTLTRRFSIVGDRHLCCPQTRFAVIGRGGRSRTLVSRSQSACAAVTPHPERPALRHGRGRPAGTLIGAEPTGRLERPTRSLRKSRSAIELDRQGQRIRERLSAILGWSALYPSVPRGMTPRPWACGPRRQPPRGRPMAQRTDCQRPAGQRWRDRESNSERAGYEPAGRPSPTPAAMTRTRCGIGLRPASWATVRADARAAWIRTKTTIVRTDNPSARVMPKCTKNSASREGEPSRLALRVLLLATSLARRAESRPAPRARRRRSRPRRACRARPRGRGRCRWRPCRPRSPASPG